MNYDKDSLILGHLDLAKDIATREWRTATHALKRDDMLSLAYEGLVDAAIRWQPYCAKNEYDPSAVQFFKVFASLRIRGTIRDHIRKEDWATRTLRSKSKKLKDAGQDDGLSVQELSEITGMTITEINKVIARLAARPISLDAYTANNSENSSAPVELKADVDTEGIAFANTLNQLFVERLKLLSNDIQVVLVLHYYSKMDLRSIAQELNISELKVSQMHESGVIAIKEALTKAATELT
jgi:RNA polymerase sigma factor for flagellar operon FliA